MSYIPDTTLETALSLYCESALAMVPRMLGLGDREPGSETFGCFDRYYWHYRVLDFPNARFQEVSWLLALLYSQEYPGNTYYKHPKIRQWALGAVDFWEKSQRHDGSFDEVYPFEHSFVATAFSTFAVTEALLLLNEGGNPNKIGKAADWLMAHENPRVANQTAGACAALYNAFLLTGENRYQEGAKQKLENLARQQHPDGYFMEYGGYDMGYLTIGLNYLAHYAEKSGNEQAEAMIHKALAFAEGKIADDGSFDYRMTSRNTQYIYPYGFLHDKTSQLIQRHLVGIRQKRAVTPLSVDDRFCIPMMINFLTTYGKGRLSQCG